jgi:hypothetical protein
MRSTGSASFELPFVREVQPGSEPDVDAARGEPNVDVRRHRLVTVPSDDRAGLDRLEPVKSGGEVRAGTAPAAEVGIERLVPLRISGMIVTPGRVGLPNLDENVATGSAQSIEHAALD